MQTSWAFRNEHPLLAQEERFGDLAHSLNLSPLTVQLLLQRGFESCDQIRKFLFPSLDHLLDPFLVPGIRESVDLVRKHLAAGSRILIHGDYDADGVTASAVLLRTFRKLRAEVFVFLPHRIHDGYGFTTAGIRFAREKEANLIITVDCGISAFKGIEEARALGMDVIVTDHHQISPQGLPQASAIIHPLIDVSGEPFKELSAVGLAFKLSQALLGEESYELLDLAALGTVGDLAPLAGENRVIVKCGLEKLGEGRNLGLASLGRQAKVHGKWNTTHLGFVLGPRVNASGRMDSADIALQLLVTENIKEADSLARILEGENKERQRLERQAVRQAVQKVEQEVNFNRDRVIVVWDKNWHPGVIGIVASRLVEKFYRPAVVISLDEHGQGKGSCRSIRHFNIFQALSQTAPLLVEYGGHEQAAGLKIQADQLEAFRRLINENAFSTMESSTLIKSYDVDLELKLSDLSRAFIEEIHLLEPFGLGNPKPVFLTRGLSIKGKPASFGKDNLKFWVEDETATLEALWYHPRSFPWDASERVDVIYTPDIRNWNGEIFPVLQVKDIKITR